MRLTGTAIDLVSFSNNRFFDNAREGLVTDFTYVPSLDNSTDYAGGDRPNGVQELRIANIFNVADASLDTGDSVILKDFGLPYRFRSLWIANNSSLTLEPAVQLLLEDNTTIQVYGSLIALGTASQPVIFEARDPEEKFESIRLNGSFTGTHVRFINGGNTTSADSSKGIISMSQPDTILNLTDSSFDGSETWGIYCNSFANAVTPENITVSNLEFTNMTEGDISPGCGVPL